MMAIYLNANELLRSIPPEDINARWLVKIMMESKEHNMTNADRLRSKTDEELAEFLCKAVSPNGVINCSSCEAAEFCGMGHCGWLDWLKQEAD